MVDFKGLGFSTSTQPHRFAGKIRFLCLHCQGKGVFVQQWVSGVLFWISSPDTIPGTRQNGGCQAIG